MPSTTDPAPAFDLSDSRGQQTPALSPYHFSAGNCRSVSPSPDNAPLQQPASRPRIGFSGPLYLFDFGSDGAIYTTEYYPYLDRPGGWIGAIDADPPCVDIED